MSIAHYRLSYLRLGRARAPPYAKHFPWQRFGVVEIDIVVISCHVVLRFLKFRKERCNMKFTKLLLALLVAVLAAAPTSYGLSGALALADGGANCTGRTNWVDCNGAFCGGYDDYYQTESDPNVTQNPSSHVCSGNGWCESKYDFTGKGGCTAP